MLKKYLLSPVLFEVFANPLIDLKSLCEDYQYVWGFYGTSQLLANDYSERRGNGTYTVYGILCTDMCNYVATLFSQDNYNELYAP